MRLRPLVQRIQAQLVERRASVGSLLYVIATLPTLGLVIIMQGMAMADPQAAALYRPGALLGAQIAVIALTAWLCGVAGYAWIKRHSHAPLWYLACLAVTPASIGLLALGIGYGLKDTPWSIAILAALFVGRALLGMRVLIPSLILGVLVLLVNELLYFTHQVNYAPLLRHPSFDGMPLDPWWSLWTRLLFNVAALPFAAMLFFMFSTLTHKRRELEDLVRTDMLTGLANRRTFMAQLEIESHRHARNKRPFCLVMCDVDHFKKINDTWGHPAGDTVLRELGRILKRTTREQLDTAARIGGEEFAVLLPETTLQQAVTMAEAMSAGVRSSIFVFDGEKVSVTQSVGIAQTDHGNGERALTVADDNLYAAKRRGRDRIEASVVEIDEQTERVESH
jgi:diguanylate cyclase (GGDEF)-like protein